MRTKRCLRVDLRARLRRFGHTAVHQQADECRGGCRAGGRGGRGGGLGGRRPRGGLRLRRLLRQLRRGRRDVLLCERRVEIALVQLLHRLLRLRRCGRRSRGGGGGLARARLRPLPRRRLRRRPRPRRRPRAGCRRFGARRRRLGPRGRHLVRHAPAQDFAVRFVVVAPPVVALHDAPHGALRHGAGAHRLRMARRAAAAAGLRRLTHKARRLFPRRLVGHRVVVVHVAILVCVRQPRARLRRRRRWGLHVRRRHPRRAVSAGPAAVAGRRRVLLRVEAGPRREGERVRLREAVHVARRRPNGRRVRLLQLRRPPRRHSRRRG